jgi:hypothetical protein
MSMQTLRLDFHPRAQRASRPLAWLALALACAVAAMAAWQLSRDAEALAALQARHDRLEARARPAAPHVEVASPELAHRVASANQAIDQLAVPWDALFHSIESADARGLGVMSLLPNARTHQLRLGGEAKTVPDVLAYVDRLAALATLQQVRLEGYETVVRDGVDVVSFTVAATWRDN